MVALYAILILLAQTGSDFVTARAQEVAKAQSISPSFQKSREALKVARGVSILQGQSCAGTVTLMDEPSSFSKAESNDPYRIAESKINILDTYFPYLAKTVHESLLTLNGSQRPKFEQLEMPSNLPCTPVTIFTVESLAENKNLIRINKSAWDKMGEGPIKTIRQGIVFFELSLVLATNLKNLAPEKMHKAALNLFSEDFESTLQDAKASSKIVFWRQASQKGIDYGLKELARHKSKMPKFESMLITRTQIEARAAQVQKGRGIASVNTSVAAENFSQFDQQESFYQAALILEQSGKIQKTSELFTEQGFAANFGKICREIDQEWKGGKDFPGRNTLIPKALKYCFTP